MVNTGGRWHSPATLSLTNVLDMDLVCCYTRPWDLKPTMLITITWF